jgi:hypothetical protein
MKPINLGNLTPLAPLPYKGMGFLKPLPEAGRGLERGLFIHEKLLRHPLNDIKTAIKCADALLLDIWVEVLTI